jgi:hypothetical protein
MSIGDGAYYGLYEKAHYYWAYRTLINVSGFQFGGGGGN